MQTLERGWSTRKFCIVLAWVLALQIGLIFVLTKTGEHSREVSLPKSPASFQMIAEPLQSAALSKMLVSDPTLFALPQEDSFSGVAWLKLRDTQHATAEWSEPPRWLGISSNHLTQSFGTFVQLGRKALLPVAEKNNPADNMLPPAPMPLMSESRISVEGRIASRLATDGITLPKWQSSEPLDATTIEIGVNAAGQVVSTRLSGRSGSDLADKEALRLVAGLVFSPDAANAVTLGRIHFLWCTVPQNTTNVTSSFVSEER